MKASPQWNFAALLALGFGLPIPAFLVARHLGRLTRADAASLGAHYGSVSVGTFAVLIGHLAAQGIAYEARAPVWVVVLEVPAILAGIVLARGFGGDVAWKPLLRGTAARSQHRAAAGWPGDRLDQRA